MSVPTPSTTLTSLTPAPLIPLEEQILAGEVDSTNSPTRYLGYLARVKPIFIASSRYLAYTSDVGEGLRPVVKPALVTAAYGVSWAYLVGDVGYEGYKARLRALQHCPEDVTTVVGLGIAKRALFQSTASMLLPALTIHSIVRYTAVGIKKFNVKNTRIRTWGPSGLGLLTIPSLPFLFDAPVEHVVEKAFEWIELKFFQARPEIRRALRDSSHGVGLKEE